MQVSHPQLSLADVFAAMAFYWDHHAEVQRGIRTAEERAAELKSRLGAGPLAEKLGPRWDRIGAGGGA